MGGRFYVSRKESGVFNEESWFIKLKFVNKDLVEFILK